MCVRARACVRVCVRAHLHVVIKAYCGPGPGPAQATETASIGQLSLCRADPRSDAAITKGAGPDRAGYKARVLPQA